MKHDVYLLKLQSHCSRSACLRIDIAQRQGDAFARDIWRKHKSKNRAAILADAAIRRERTHRIMCSLLAHWDWVAFDSTNVHTIAHYLCLILFIIILILYFAGPHFDARSALALGACIFDLEFKWIINTLLYAQFSSGPMPEIKLINTSCRWWKRNEQKERKRNKKPTETKTCSDFCTQSRSLISFLCSCFRVDSRLGTL